jgi:hypothetical protein
MTGVQSSIGNHAVQRLISSRYIQTKLQVSTPGDPFEQEADRVADKVMRMPEPPPEAIEENEESKSLQAKPLVQRAVPLAVRDDDEEEQQIPPVHRSAIAVIQRLCTDCEEEKQEDQEEPGTMVHRKVATEELPETDEVEEQQVQSSRDQIAAPKVTTSVAANIHAMNGGGNPLPHETRAFFEPRFGADFSRVRVHTDSHAAETANSIRARAFTVGQNIAFGTGRYEPHSHAGRQLLAHELTHVVQQNGLSRSMAARSADVHVQRYVSGEHMEAGEAAATGRTITLDLWVGPPAPFTKTKKLVLSYGEVNALLEDYYEGWSQLKKAPAPEVEQLVALFMREQKALGGKGTLPSEAEYEQATAGRKTGTQQPGAATKTYLELAKENVPHFSPDNRDRYADLHKQALKRGVEAFKLRGQGKTADADAAEADAFLINADADHFLQDAFAAGHLMNKPLIQLATVEFWTAGIGRAARDNIITAALSDQARVWAEIERHVLPNLTAAQRWALRHMFDRPDAIRRVINQILDRIEGRPDLTANLGAKLVHDHLNRNGLQVYSEDDPKTGWRTFGDNFMSKGVSKNKVVAAQKASVANVQSAVKDGLGQVGTKPTNIDAFLKTNNPWRLVPRWAEVPVGTRREVGTALADKSWVQDLLKTLLFRNDTSSPLYLLLLDNLQLIGGITAAEEQATTQRHTKQASEAEKLLKRFSKSFAKGGDLKDLDSAGLARALKGKSADLFQEVLDELEPADKDDDVAEEFAELHPSRADLVALDPAVLLAMASAMRGGFTTWGEAHQIARIEAAFSFKVGQGLLGRLPASERKGGQKILDTIGTQGQQHIADLGQASSLQSSAAKQEFQPKELAADCKGQDAAVLLGVIEALTFDEEIAAWLEEFVALHTDAELGALDVAVLKAAAKKMRRGNQRKRAEKALADAKAAGATSTAKADWFKGVDLVRKRRFVTYPTLAKKLKGKSSEVIIAALQTNEPSVAADFTKLHTNDELAKLDLGVLHSLEGRVTDPTELGRVQKALQNELKAAGTRTAI